MYMLTTADITSNAHNFLIEKQSLSYSDINQMMSTTSETSEATPNFAALCDAMYLSGNNDINLTLNYNINYISDTVRPITTM